METSVYIAQFAHSLVQVATFTVPFLNIVTYFKRCIENNGIYQRAAFLMCYHYFAIPV